MIKSFINSILIFTLTLSTPWVFAETTNTYGWDCKKVLTNTPPFWVTDADSTMREKNYDNFKGLTTKDGVPVNSLNVSKNNIGYINRRSTVRILDDEYSLTKSSGRDYLPVEVISSPSKKEDDNRKKLSFSSGYGSPQLSATRSGLKRVHPGQKGYIYGGHIKRVKEPNAAKGTEEFYTERRNSSVIAPSLSAKLTPGKEDVIFVVTEDTAFINPDPHADLAPNASLKNRPLKVATEKGQYLTTKCTNPYDEEDFEITYAFDVLNEDLTSSDRRIYFDPKCKDIEALLPIPKKQYSELNDLRKALEEKNRDELDFKDINLWSQKGLVMIPMGKPVLKEFKDTDGSKLQRLYVPGPYGSYHYVSSKFTIPNNKDLYSPDNPVLTRALKELASDHYMKPKSLCSFMSALKDFKKNCPNCGPIQWGDAYWPKSKGGQRHSTHGGGHCIDFRPPRKDDAIGPSAYTGGFNAKAAKIFIKSLKQAGATDIIFTPLSSRTNGVRGYRNHSRHMHVCFDPNKERNNKIPGRRSMKKACTDLRKK